MPTFYHYTSSKGAQAIVNNPVIRPSQARDNFPAGVHFTTLAPDVGAEAVAANNWDGAAVVRWNTWRKRVTHYIIVTVNDGVIQPTPGDHGRNLHFFPDEAFDLVANANSYEVCEFEGDVLISDVSNDAMKDFLDAFEIEY